MLAKGMQRLCSTLYNILDPNKGYFDVLTSLFQVVVDRGVPRWPWVSLLHCYINSVEINNDVLSRASMWMDVN
jgi:hypothetical protein